MRLVFVLCSLGLYREHAVYAPPRNYATLKRMPMFNFPMVWNQDGNEKFSTRSPSPTTAAVILNYLINRSTCIRTGDLICKGS
jgi:hypothetical protein